VSDPLDKMCCPPDIIEWGTRHNIPLFAERTWIAGFKAGVRASSKPTQEETHTELISLLGFPIRLIEG